MGDAATTSSGEAIVAALDAGLGHDGGPALDLAGGDAFAGDADTHDAATGGTFALTAVEVRFAAPRTALIGWWPQGVPHDFARYEVWYGADRSAVEQTRAPAQRWGPGEDPNLASLIEPAPQVIRETMLLGLQPGRSYAAVLRVVSTTETELTRSATLTFSTPTPPTSGTLDIFRDAELPGAWLLGEPGGGAMAAAAANPFGGTQAIAAPASGADDGFVLHYGFDAVPLALSAQQFQGAYLEFAVACTGGTVNYAEVRLSGPGGRAVNFSWPDYYTSFPSYHLIQVPLSAMKDEASQEPAVASSLTAIDQFWVWGPWPAGTVYLDEIRIVY